MRVVMRPVIWRILLLCGIIHSVLASGNIIPVDYSNMTCHLANGKEGICVYAYLCNNDVVNTDGAMIIDLRYSDDCEDYFLKCCSKESPCMERAGTCLPKNQCNADLNASKYGKFKESDECDWSGYQCCPNDPDQQGTINTDSESNKDSEVICDEDSICVPDEQCMVNADGVNLVEKRISTCEGLSTCCPRNQIRMNATNSCEMIGGTCIRKGTCESPYNVALRSETCSDPESECCMDNNQTTTSEGQSSEGKRCFNNIGICVQKTKCEGIKYTDRKNDCGGLTCCGEHSTTTTSPGGKSTTEEPEIDTDSPAIDQTDDITCSSLAGTCEAEEDCQRKTTKQPVDCAENSVCCLSKGSRDVPTASGEVSNVKECGYRNEDGIKFDTISRDDGEAQYGEFPWMVAILVNNSGKETPHCGGTLIDPEVVITTASCVKSFRRKPDQLIVRAGEWDMGATMEPIPHQERRVRKIRGHGKFSPHSLVNNIALLFLEDKFDLTPTINTVCLPPQDFIIDNGILIATGWGTTPQNRTKYQQILKSIDLQYTQKSDCERALRKATRNNRFKLDSSFICAGGEAGKDTCKGDAGSPVIFPIPDDLQLRYYAVGMVSWGVGCGRPGTPAVYTDIGVFREWVDKTMEEEELHMLYYDYQPEDPNANE